MRCEVCGKNHQHYRNKRIKVEGKWVDVQTIESPCLKKISKEAVNLLG